MDQFVLLQICFLQPQPHVSFISSSQAIVPSWTPHGNLCKVTRSLAAELHPCPERVEVSTANLQLTPFDLAPRKLIDKNAETILSNKRCPSEFWTVQA